MIGTARCKKAQQDSADRRIGVVQAYRAALAAHDSTAVAALLAPDARVWYEKRVGEGEPLTAGGDRYAGWDREFQSQSSPLGEYQITPTPWGDAVWVVVQEMNDYYRLTDRSYSLTMLMWFVDDSSRIQGQLVAAVGDTQSRAAEFKAWAGEQAKAELDYLMPAGRIDPTGDRPQRMRALLERWRHETQVNGRR